MIAERVVRSCSDVTVARYGARDDALIRMLRFRSPMSRIEQRPRMIVCERPADLALRRCHVLHVARSRRSGLRPECLPGHAILECLRLTAF